MPPSLSRSGAIAALRRWLMPALGLALLATALLATPVGGAARWVAVGPLVLQVSLIVLPAMLILFSRNPDASGAAGLAIAALALALQPDRAMAGALAAGAAALAFIRRNRPTDVALATAVCAFAATLGQFDRLPAVPFVDAIFYTAFDLHPLAGAALLLGAALLIVPAWVGRRADRQAAAAFAAVWTAIIVAAAIGNYPTPVVGYGGSAIVGYLLSSLCAACARERGLTLPDCRAERRWLLRSQPVGQRA